MPRTRIATRKSYGAPRAPRSSGQTSSSSQPPTAHAPNQENLEEIQNGREDRGKGPAPTDLENEESSSQAETEYEAATESDEELCNIPIF